MPMGLLKLQAKYVPVFMRAYVSLHLGFNYGNEEREMLLLRPLSAP
jgi:hypothetical protein